MNDLQLRRRLNAILRIHNIPGAAAYIASGRTQFPPAVNNVGKRSRYEAAFALPWDVQAEGGRLIYQHQPTVTLEVAYNDHERTAILDAAFDQVGLGVGIDSLYEFVASYWLNITRDHVRDYLRTQISYQLTRKTTTKSNPLVRPKAPKQIWAVDLIDMTSMVYRGNQHHKYIISVLDVFTRQVWLRSLPNKNAATIQAAFALICTPANFPRTLQIDNGTEFVDLLAYARGLGVSIVHSHSYSGVSWIEQVNGSVRDAIAQLGVQRGNKVWHDKLSDIEGAINAKNSTWMQVEKRERAQAKREAVAEEHQPMTQKFHVGDRVRVAKIAYESAVRKMNADGFQKHVYVKRSQLVYRIRSVLNQSIVNGFYTYTLHYENAQQEAGQTVEDYPGHAMLIREKDLTGPIPNLQRGVLPTDPQIAALNRK